MIRPQQNDEPASQWRSLDVQNIQPGRGDTEPVAEIVGVVGGSMSGKGSVVNTGYPWGRTTTSRRAGDRAIIVVMKRVMTVERRMVGRRTREARGAAKTTALVPERAVRRKTKSPLRIASTSAEHSQNKGWSLDGLPHVSRGFNERSAWKRSNP